MAYRKRFSSSFPMKRAVPPVPAGDEGMPGWAHLPRAIRSEVRVHRVHRRDVPRHDEWAEPSQDTLPLGALTNDVETPEQISLYLPITGTLGEDHEASVRYRIATVGEWRDAAPLWRIEPELSSPTVPDEAFAGVIVDLSPGVSYDVEVTVSDGVTSEVFSETFSTRNLPRAAGAVTASATTYAELQAAINAASPGDVIEFSGDIDVATSQLTFNNVSGTEADPIFIRGDHRDTARLVGDNGRGIQLLTAHHIVFENFTCVGAGVDGGATLQDGFIGFWDGAPGQTNVCFRRLKFTGIDKGIINSAASNQCLVYDCVFEGNNVWTQEFLESSITWNDDGVRLGGHGVCVFNNDFTGFGDPISYRRETTDFPVIGCFIYRNKVRRSGDDAIEAEYCQRNCAVYDNDIANCMTGISVDGIFGGPFYYFRNRVVNCGRTIIKNGADATGVLIWANAFVKTTGRADSAGGVRGWYWSITANLRDWEYRNNLFLWEGSDDIFRFDEAQSGFTPWRCTHNGWGRNGQDIEYASGGPAGDVATVNAALTPLHDNDIELTNQAAVFETPVVLGANYLTEITTDYSLALSASSEAIGAGVVIPNICESGDIGPYGASESPPAIGNRYSPDDPSWMPAVGEIGLISSETLRSAIQAITGGNTFAGRGIGITAPWSGGDIVELSGQPYLVVYGGGHSDSAFNGLMKFGPLAGVGSDTPAWSVFLANSDAADVQEGPTYADGRQASPHTYNIPCGVDDALYVLSTDGYYLSGGDSPLAFVFRTSGQTALASNTRSGGTLHGACAHFNGKIYQVSGGSAFDFLRIYDTSGNSWSVEPSGDDFAMRNYTKVAIDTQRAKLLALGGSGPGVTLSAYWDLTTLARTDDPVALPTGSSSNALLYDPERDAFVSLDQNDPTTVYELDAASLAAGGSPSWTTRTFGGVTPPALEVAGTNGRFRYISSLKGYVLLPTMDNGIYFMRSAA